MVLIWRGYFCQRARPAWSAIRSSTLRQRFLSISRTQEGSARNVFKNIVLSWNRFKICILMAAFSHFYLRYGLVFIVRVLLPPLQSAADDFYSLRLFRLDCKPGLLFRLPFGHFALSSVKLPSVCAHAAKHTVACLLFDFSPASITPLCGRHVCAGYMGTREWPQLSSLCSWNGVSYWPGIHQVE